MTDHDEGTSVTVVSLDVSLKRLDGGGKRVHAFLDALAQEGYAVDLVGVGPRGIDGVAKVVSSPVHRLKRRLFPISFRGPVEAELSAVHRDGPVVSLVASANRWSLRGQPTWLDFPDLWSNIARNHARSVDPISTTGNLAQSRLWSHREAGEYARANVVSVASWSDRVQLGSKAVWLPTPVSASSDLLRQRRSSSATEGGVVYGMIANFDYPPNQDAYRRLLRDWLPVLQPSSRRVVVAGFGSESLPRTTNVDVLGPVREVSDFYDAVDVVLAPIELGGGMKVKVVEAMMHGLPVIATEHAADGLPGAIADECARWGSLPRRWRDPRENPAVAEALEQFTAESFQKNFSAAWRQEMTARV